MSNEKLTITLTGRPPVRVIKAEWPIIASAKAWDNTYECQANRTWRMTVRQHSDGRTIVYGVYDSSYQGEATARAGALLPAGADIAETIAAVAEGCGCERIADQCVASLPAEEI